MEVDRYHERMAEVKKRWLGCYFRIQVLKVCLSSSVLATAAIRLKTKEKKDTLFTELGNTTDT